MGSEDYEELPADRAVTLEEAADHKRRVVARNEPKKWRWAGNSGDPYQVAALANQDPPQVAGEVVFVIQGDLYPSWLFY
ncbi:hypothetical protein GCM10010217_43410 [Streptomyces tubercidicus]